MNRSSVLTLVSLCTTELYSLSSTTMKLSSRYVILGLASVATVFLIAGLNTCCENDEAKRCEPFEIAKYANESRDNSHSHHNRSTLVVLNSVGEFADRVREFQRILGHVRKHSWDLRDGNTIAWSGRISSSWSSNVVWTGCDDFMERLTLQHGQHVTTVALPWVKAEQQIQHSSMPIWNSIFDRTNLLLQNYFQWTADDQLCTWIETPGAIKARYDLVYNRTCERNMVEGASTPRSIKPLMFNTISVPPEPIPENFYTRLPPNVFTLHVVRDAVVSSTGEVISGSLKLVR